MITINSMEVHFEVEGDDKQRFAQLFAEFIGRWASEAEARKARDQRAARERSLGDHAAGGVGP